MPIKKPHRNNAELTGTHHCQGKAIGTTKIVPCMHNGYHVRMLKVCPVFGSEPASSLWRCPQCGAQMTFLDASTPAVVAEAEGKHGMLFGSTKAAEEAGFDWKQIKQAIIMGCKHKGYNWRYA
jgi:hypothetical protein